MLVKGTSSASDLYVCKRIPTEADMLIGVVILILWLEFHALHTFSDLSHAIPKSIIP